jgi:hypothetical protein
MVALARARVDTAEISLKCVRIPDQSGNISYGGELLCLP